MTNTTASRILLAFAYEGFRSFFRPKPREILQLPRHNVSWIAQKEESELAERPYRYLYAGVAVEFLVGVVLFFVFLGLSIGANTLMTLVVERYANIEKWSGFIDLLTGGTSFFGLALLLVFSLKLARDLLTHAFEL